MIHSGLPAAWEDPLHALLAFATFFFSMFHAASIRHTLSMQPSITMSEPAPSRAEIAHYQEATVYSGSGCITCQKTNITSSAH